MKRISLTVMSAALGATLLATGCTDDATVGDGGTVTTGVSVDPLLFLGDVACAHADGAMKTYVATLTDVTTPDAPFTLPSSPPTSCSQEVSFRFVVAGHTYSAEIDGYDTGLGGELTPFGGASSGSRRMFVEGDDGVAVLASPRWTTACGQGATGAAVAIDFENVLVRGCDPLLDHGTPLPPSVAVDPTAALGALRCSGADGGTVASFTVTPHDAAMPAFTGLACGGEPVVYATGIVAGQTYGFHVATVIDAISWGADCTAVAKAGGVATAGCAALTPLGAIEIDVADLLDAGGLVCGDDVLTYEAVVFSGGFGGLTLTSGPVACGSVARFSPLEPGAYGATAHARDAKGEVVLSASCSASVVGGSTATASCTQDP